MRLALIVLAILLLGLVSFVFGIFISVTSELPSLSHFSLFKDAKSSVLLDDHGRQIGVLSQHNRVIVTPSQIPAIVKQAVISIEDKRFYTNGGIDLRGIVRALVADIRHRGGVQGASTIEQQFIKTALQAQSHRTILEKLREAALAFQLSHKWSKDKIITAYLNTIYFGSGAYGVEAAAETYFGQDVNHQGCGTPGHQLCVEQLQPWEAALLAGHHPVPQRATTPPRTPSPRANAATWCCTTCSNRATSREPSTTRASARRCRRKQQVDGAARADVEGVDAGYFTSWVQQQVIERYGAPRAFDGGLHDPHDARPRTAARGRTGRSTTTSHTPEARPRRSSRSKTRPARCARWSAGATTTKAPSTSPPRASASPARRSRPSTSPPR